MEYIFIMQCTNNMQPRTFDNKEDLENIIASVSPVKDTLEINIKHYDGKFYIYNVNGSLLAYECQTKYVYVWGLQIHTFYLIDDEIINFAGSLKSILEMLSHNLSSLELQYEKLPHAVDIIKFQLSQKN